MAMFELEEVDAEALRRLAAQERRSIDELATEAVRDLIARRGGSGDLGREIDRVKADAHFMDRANALVERDREILDRLAQ